MTDPAPSRPISGPPRPGPHPPVPGPPVQDPATAADPSTPGGSRFADLAERPVADHVAVYEAEHERLQRELSTIDQL
ncbi:MAG: uncharacterized protein JWR28_1098 [Modestobacter sp.]|nr:uncharacterized protein [Modestobacter sp.]